MLRRAVLHGWLGFVEATSLDWVERHELSRGTLRDLLADLLPDVVRLAMLHAAADPGGADGLRAPEAPARAPRSDRAAPRRRGGSGLTASPSSVTRRAHVARTGHGGGTR